MKVSSDPTITVMMPAFNAVKYIRESIESVLGQDFEDFELIVIDDHSSDRTFQIASEFKKDPRVCVYKNGKRRGDGRTRNRILGLARGKYIALHDADDIMLQGRLRRQFEVLESHPDVGVVFGKALVSNERMNRISAFFVPVRRDGSCFKRSGLARVPPQSIGLCNSMVRRSLMLRAGGFDTKMPIGSDSDLFLRLIPLASFYFLSHFCFIYRRHPGSFSSTYRLEVERRRFRIFRGDRNGLWRKPFVLQVGRSVFRVHSRSARMVRTIAWRLRVHENDGSHKPKKSTFLKNFNLVIKGNTGDGVDDGTRFDAGFLKLLARLLARENAMLLNASLMAKDGEGLLLVGGTEQLRAKIVLSFLVSDFFYLSFRNPILYLKGGKVFGRGLAEPVILPSGAGWWKKVYGSFWNPLLERYCLDVNLFKPHLIRDTSPVSKIVYVKGAPDSSRMSLRRLEPAELLAFLSRDPFAKGCLEWEEKDTVLRRLTNQAEGFLARVPMRKVNSLARRFEA